MVERAAGPTALRILLGTQLRRLREQHGMTAREAARAIAGSESKISRIELGRTSVREVDIADLLTLADVSRYAAAVDRLGAASAPPRQTRDIPRDILRDILRGILRRDACGERAGNRHSADGAVHDARPAGQPAHPAGLARCVS